MILSVGFFSPAGDQLTLLLTERFLKMESVVCGISSMPTHQQNNPTTPLVFL